MKSGYFGVVTTGGVLVVVAQAVTMATEHASTENRPRDLATTSPHASAHGFQTELRHEASRQVHLDHRAVAGGHVTVDLAVTVDPA
jgi:hypothetical protein